MFYVIIFSAIAAAVIAYHLTAVKKAAEPKLEIKDAAVAEPNVCCDDECICNKGPLGESESQIVSEPVEVKEAIMDLMSLPEEIIVITDNAPAPVINELPKSENPKPAKKAKAKLEMKKFDPSKGVKTTKHVKKEEKKPAAKKPKVTKVTKPAKKKK